MKTPLLLLGICTGLYGSAQMIELSDTLSTGDNMSYYVLDSNAVSLSEVTGADAVWDYSDIAAYNIAPNANNVINAVDSDFGASYPDSDYSEDFDNSVKTFFSNDPDNNQVLVHGFVFEEASNDFIIKYEDDALISYKYPMDLGDTYTDDIAGVATLPLAGDVDITGEATITADGTGTLKVGTNEYTNVIRVHTVEVSEGLILGSPATITRESYVYYDIDNFNMPIFIHAHVLAEVGAAGDFGFTAVYSKDEITDYLGVDEIANESIDLNVYPNPIAGDFATISTDAGTETLTVLNSLGQTIFTINNPKTTETIDVSEFNTGIYFVQATKGNAVRTAKFVVK